ncbi:MAG: hypothetical protein SNH71_04400 [Rikenellaceae bacterium]
MAKKKIIDYFNKFDSTHVIIVGLLLLYVAVFGLAAYYNDNRYFVVVNFFVIIALVVVAYLGHRSRMNTPMFLGRPLNSKSEVALRNFVLDVYSTKRDKPNETSPKSLAMLTAVLNKNGFLLQHTDLKKKVAALFTELGRENEMEKYQSINRYLNKELKFVNPNDENEKTNDLETIFDNILKN